MRMIKTTHQKENQVTYKVSKLHKELSVQFNNEVPEPRTVPTYNRHANICHINSLKLNIKNIPSILKMTSIPIVTLLFYIIYEVLLNVATF